MIQITNNISSNEFLSSLSTLSIFLENPKHIMSILECALSWYGKGCSLPCGRCRKHETCNHVDGHCPGGCAPGWSGIYCNESKY